MGSSSSRPSLSSVVAHLHDKEWVEAKYKQTLARSDGFSSFCKEYYYTGHPPEDAGPEDGGTEEDCDVSSSEVQHSGSIVSDCVKEIGNLLHEDRLPVLSEMQLCLLLDAAAATREESDGEEDEGGAADEEEVFHVLLAALAARHHIITPKKLEKVNTAAVAASPVSSRSSRGAPAMPSQADTQYPMSWLSMLANPGRGEDGAAADGSAAPAGLRGMSILQELGALENLGLAQMLGMREGDMVDELMNMVSSSGGEESPGPHSVAGALGGSSNASSGGDPVRPLVERRNGVAVGQSLKEGCSEEQYHRRLILVPYMWQLWAVDPLAYHALHTHSFFSAQLGASLTFQFPQTPADMHAEDLRQVRILFGGSGLLDMKVGESGGGGGSAAPDLDTPARKAMAELILWCLRQRNLSSTLLLLDLLRFYMPCESMLIPRSSEDNEKLKGPVGAELPQEESLWQSVEEELGKMAKHSAFDEAEVKKQEEAVTSEVVAVAEDAQRQETIAMLAAACCRSEPVCRVALERHAWNPDMAMCWLLDNDDLAASMQEEMDSDNAEAPSTEEEAKEPEESDSVHGASDSCKADLREVSLRNMVFQRGRFLIENEKVVQRLLTVEEPLQEKVEEDKTMEEPFHDKREEEAEDGKNEKEEIAPVPFRAGGFQSLQEFLWVWVDRLLAEVNTDIGDAQCDMHDALFRFLDAAPLSLPLLVSHANGISKSLMQESLSASLPFSVYVVGVISQLLWRVAVSCSPSFTVLKQCTDIPERISIANLSSFLETSVTFFARHYPRAFLGMGALSEAAGLFDSARSRGNRSRILPEGSSVEMAKITEAASGSDADGPEQRIVKHLVPELTDFWKLTFEIMHPTPAARSTLFSKWTDVLKSPDRIRDRGTLGIMALFVCSQEVLNVPPSLLCELLLIGGETREEKALRKSLNQKVIEGADPSVDSEGAQGTSRPSVAEELLKFLCHVQSRDALLDPSLSMLKERPWSDIFRALQESLCCVVEQAVVELTENVVDRVGISKCGDLSLQLLYLFKCAVQEAEVFFDPTSAEDCGPALQSSVLMKILPDLLVAIALMPCYPSSMVDTMLPVTLRLLRQVSTLHNVLLVNSTNADGTTAQEEEDDERKGRSIEQLIFLIQNSLYFVAGKLSSSLISGCTLNEHGSMVHTTVRADALTEQWLTSDLFRKGVQDDELSSVEGAFDFSSSRGFSKFFAVLHQRGIAIRSNRTPFSSRPTNTHVEMVLKGIVAAVLHHTGIWPEVIECCQRVDNGEDVEKVVETTSGLLQGCVEGIVRKWRVVEDCKVRMTHDYQALALAMGDSEEMPTYAAVTSPLLDKVKFLLGCAAIESPLLTDEDGGAEAASYTMSAVWEFLQKGPSVQQLSEAMTRREKYAAQRLQGWGAIEELIESADSAESLRSVLVWIRPSTGHRNQTPSGFLQWTSGAKYSIVEQVCFCRI